MPISRRSTSEASNADLRPVSMPSGEASIISLSLVYFVSNKCAWAGSLIILFLNQDAAVNGTASAITRRTKGFERSAATIKSIFCPARRSPISRRIKRRCCRLISLERHKISISPPPCQIIHTRAEQQNPRLRIDPIDRITYHLLFLLRQSHNQP